MQNYEQLAEIIKTLGHPLRLQIVALLKEEGEACVCHMEHRTGQRQAYISQHLSRLREAGLVSDRRDGMNVFYSLTTEVAGRILEIAYQIADSLPVSAEADVVATQSDTVRTSCPCPKCQASALPISTVG